MRRSLYFHFKYWEHTRRYRGWARAGKPIPAPHFVKQLTIKSYARQSDARVMVETGTYTGDMVGVMVGVFAKIYSIEVDEALFRAAQEKFRRHRHVHLRRGDSAVEMPKILSELGERAIFWLDGHYTGPHAGKADLNTPIVQELSAIAQHPIKDHILLIDDARLFTGKNDYPSVEFLKEMAGRLFPNGQFSNEDDIIRICPVGQL